jgi:hypothetical protein
MSHDKTEVFMKVINSNLLNLFGGKMELSDTNKKLFALRNFKNNLLNVNVNLDFNDFIEEEIVNHKANVFYLYGQLPKEFSANKFIKGIKGEFYNYDSLIQNVKDDKLHNNILFFAKSKMVPKRQKKDSPIPASSLAESSKIVESQTKIIYYKPDKIELQSDFDYQRETYFRNIYMRIDENKKLNMPPFNQEKSMKPIENSLKINKSHVDKRILILKNKLDSNKQVQIVIPGIPHERTDIYVKHLIGTGLAINEWENRPLFNPMENLIAWFIFINYIQDKINEMRNKYGNERVAYGNLNEERASDFIYMVWGTNSYNVEGDDGHFIMEYDQAFDLRKYGPGVFGIISTPLMRKPISDDRQLEIARHNHEIISRSSPIREKYLKYKLKYHHLKKMLINN